MGIWGCRSMGWVRRDREVSSSSSDNRIHRRAMAVESRASVRERIRVQITTYKC